MKIFSFLVSFYCLFLAMPFFAIAISKPTEVTFIVVDEQNRPLEGAEVRMGFEQDEEKSFGRSSIVDGDGRFSTSGDSNSVITYGASKDGYYSSRYVYKFRKLSQRGWEPWNPELKIVMRKIEKQIPMYIRDTKMFEKKVEIPVVGKDVGFDLIAYDWVPPYGNGKNVDFIFHLNSRFSSNNDYEFDVILKFYDGNGIQKVEEDISQGSTFNLPRYAPEYGYSQHLTLFTKRTPGKSIERSRTEDVNYVFRLRSKKENNNIISAIYGKILGDFYVRPRSNGKAIIEFNYYLNPDGTRNLEHDPKRNLFYE